MNALKFTLKSNAVPVTLEADGTVVELELREMTASARDSYLDRLSSRMRFDNAGKPAGIKKFDGMQAELLAACLFHKEGGKAVITAEIQGWPASVVSDLYKAAQEMNHLNVAAEGKVEAPPKD